MSEYKRFIVFGFDEYYPSGGMRDVVDSFDTIREAIDYANEIDSENAQVFDCLNMAIVDLPV